MTKLRHDVHVAIFSVTRTACVRRDDLIADVMKRTRCSRDEFDAVLARHVKLGYVHVSCDDDVIIGAW